MMRWTRGLLLAAAAGAIGMGMLAPTSAQDKPGKKEKGPKRGALTFEVYKDKGDEFRWRLKAANGQNIGGSGQGYAQKSDCIHAIDVIKAGAAKAEVKEVMDADK